MESCESKCWNYWFVSDAVEQPTQPKHIDRYPNFLSDEWWRDRETTRHNPKEKVTLRMNTADFYPYFNDKKIQISPILARKFLYLNQGYTFKC